MSRFIRSIYCLLLILPALRSECQTISIYRGGLPLPTTYTSLNTAIAFTVNHDSLVFSPHTFYEHDITLPNKILTFTGTISGADTTTFDAMGMGRVLLANLTRLKLRDIVFTGGRSISGGAIYAWAGDSLTLTGCTTVRDNVATGDGGGIFWGEGKVVLKEHARVCNNRAVNGGGICITRSVYMQDSAGVTGNYASRNGGGIACLNTVTTPSQIGIKGNTTLEGNVADSNGAGLFTGTSKTAMLSIENTTFSNNISTYGKGGAIYHGGRSNLTIKNCVFTGNISSKGATIFIDSNSDASVFPNITLSKCYCYNADITGGRQNEVYFAFGSAGGILYTDTTWWGNTDTAGLIAVAAGNMLAVPSFVVADWKLNGGAPVRGISSFPVAAQFKLNTGQPMKSGTFPMLNGKFSCSAGTFTPATSAITIANVISSSYSVPAVSATVNLMAVVDADTFKAAVPVTGTGVLENAPEDESILYPIPATDQLYIQGLTSDAMVYITDPTGKIVDQQALAKNSGPSVLDIHQLPPGVYLLKVNYKNGTVWLGKLMKQ